MTARLVLAALALVPPLATALAAMRLPELRGQVLDAESRQPIAGAYVAVVYKGDEPGSIIPHGGHRGVCIHLALTRTDAAGRFTIPADRVKERFINLRYNVSTYHPGFLSRNEEIARKATEKNIYKDLRSLPTTRDQYSSYALWGWNSIKDPDNHIERLWRDPGADGRTERYRLPGGKVTDIIETLRIYYLRSRSYEVFTCPWIADSPRDLNDLKARVLYPMLKAMYEEAKAMAKTETDHINVRIICHRALSGGEYRWPDNNAVPPPCDIDNVPPSWKAWEQELNARVAAEPSRRGDKALPPPPAATEEEAAGLTPAEWAKWQDLLAAAATDLGVPVYPGAQPLAPDSPFLDPDTVRRLLADFQARPQVLQGKGFMLLRAPDSPQKVMTFYRKVFSDRRPQIIPHANGGYGIQVVGSDHSLTSVLLLPLGEHSGTLIIAIRLHEQAQGPAD